MSIRIVFIARKHIFFSSPAFRKEHTYRPMPSFITFNFSIDVLKRRRRKKNTKKNERKTHKRKFVVYSKECNSGRQVKGTPKVII